MTLVLYILIAPILSACSGCNDPSPSADTDTDTDSDTDTDTDSLSCVFRANQIIDSNPLRSLIPIH